MPEAPIDPRRAGFATAIRPGPKNPPAGPDTPAQPPVRGLHLSAPPKPVVSAPAAEPVGAPADVPLIPGPPGPGIPGTQSSTTPSGRSATSGKEASPPEFESEDPAVRYGSRRGSLTFVASSMSGPVAEAFEAVAVDADVVLGEVLMASVRNYVEHTSPTSHALRRRRGGNPVRREIGVRPAEAIEIYRAADERMMRPSALMREALEQYLPSADVFRPSPLA